MIQSIQKYDLQFQEISEDAQELIKLILTVNPNNRPSIDQILQSKLVRTNFQIHARDKSRTCLSES